MKSRILDAAFPFSASSPAQSRTTINQPAHRDPVERASGALHLLAQTSPDLEEVRDAITDIVHEDNRGRLTLSPGCRNLLRKGERKSEPVDLNDLVMSTIVLLNSELIRRRIEVETDLAGHLPVTFGDPVQLQQVLLNLFMNAMDAMASTAEPQRRIKVSTRATGRPMPSRCGSGIAAPASRRNRQDSNCSSRSTRPETHGLGLGLTICSTIAQAHGGKLRPGQSSGSGRGRGLVAAGPGVFGGCQMTDGMFTVFLVDDDAGVLKALSRLLRAKGYDVRPFASAEAFLEAMTRRLCRKLAPSSMSRCRVSTAWRCSKSSPPAASSGRSFSSPGKSDIPEKRARDEGRRRRFSDQTGARQGFAGCNCARRSRKMRERAKPAPRVAAIEAKIATLTPREREVLHPRDSRPAQQTDRRRFGNGGNDHQGPLRTDDGEARRAYGRRPGAPRRKASIAAHGK